MATTQSHKLQLQTEVGKAQRYGSREAIISAANRALRWVRQPRNQGRKPPRHIANKMMLIGVSNA